MLAGETKVRNPTLTLVRLELVGRIELPTIFIMFAEAEGTIVEYCRA